MSDEVHLLCAPLDTTPVQYGRLEQSLSPDELERAGRFRFPKDRAHFVAAHGALRHILAGYLECRPAELRFSYGASGKPALAPGWGADTLRFNLSHSHGLALCAVALSREVGVDLEFVRPLLGDSAIPERFFSPAEVLALRALPAESQPEAFFNCWTRKEAYIKARGEGLSIPLDSFEVSLAPGEPAALVKAPDRSRWSLRALVPAPGYVAAVVAEGDDWRLRLFNWPGGRGPP
jgi:4'-phosphopantetheinyl transferase